MFYGINEVAVVVTTLLSLAVGSIWFSPVLFGKAWMNAAHLQNRGESPQRETIKLFGFAAIANLVLLFVLAHAVLWAKELGFTILEMSIYVAVLLSATLVSFAVWEERGIRYIAIVVPYIALITVLGMHVIAYWPW